MGIVRSGLRAREAGSTYRIALLGASRAAGWGVDHDERFETLIERKLNRENVGGTYKNYEILNFSVDAYTSIQRLLTFEEKAARFRPDAVIYIASKRDMIFDHHARMVRRNVPMPYDFVVDINRRANIDASLSESEIGRRMQPFRHELVSRVYRRLAGSLQENGMRGISIYIPDVTERAMDAPADPELTRLASAVGFATVDLSAIFVNTGDPASHRLSRWDSHPNKRGHQLIADAIYERLKTLQEEGKIDMGLSRGAAKN